jgi:hypothetical protein
LKYFQSRNAANALKLKTKEGEGGIKDLKQALDKLQLMAAANGGEGKDGNREEQESML